ncbi:MAG: helix-turn-helix transcriptional regulator, partial [Oscillospiraceae bacterium]|nr:helix-turn-helix transcriptional regulator [Oscillospiraceae bacterium]
MDAEKVRSLTDALEYIESRLSDEISQEECARAACCSLSGLQKMFRYVFHRSVGDYITRRRLSKAAKDLQTGELSVLEIAMKYGYGSAEAFT